MRDGGEDDEEFMHQYMNAAAAANKKVDVSEIPLETICISRHKSLAAEVDTEETD